MSTANTVTAAWDRRIARAGALADAAPPAAAVLRFYGAVAERQRALASAASQKRASPDGDASFPAALDLAATVAAIPDFLAWLRHEPLAPGRLTTAADELAPIAPAAWRHFAESHLTPPSPDRPSASPDAVIPDADLMVFVLMRAIIQLAVVLAGLSLGLSWSGGILGMILAFALRGALLFRVFGIVIQTMRGDPASRLRCLWRSVVVWIPFWIPLLAGQVLFVLTNFLRSAQGPGGFVLASAPAALTLLLLMVGWVYALIRPERGLPHLIAGTHLVPK